MKLGKTVAESTAGFDDPRLTDLREQARAAEIARRKSFVARLSLPADNGDFADVPFWSAAIQQIEQHRWRLVQWSVCPEASGPVAYAVFVPA